MATGKIKFFNGKRGFGFIEPDDGSCDVFVHLSAVAQGTKLCENDRVVFDVGPGRNGNPAASNVRLIDA
jgi:CspA family cold shock protein